MTPPPILPASGGIAFADGIGGGVKTWLNGVLLEEEKATISIFDRSYLYGEGVFETLRCYQGKPAFLDRHFQRLKKNLKSLQILAPFSEKELADWIQKLLNANQLQEAVVRITVSLVGASFGLDRPAEDGFNITLFCRPPTLNPKFFQTGVKVFPSPSLVNESLPQANIKSTSYLTKMLARTQAARAGAYETLLKNAKGFWAEGSRTNFFIVLNHTVITAPLADGILNGITREVVLEILKEEAIPHREDSISDAMLQNAEEIFLTGSTSEVMPVNEVLGMWKKEISKEALVFQLQKEYHCRR